MYLEERRFLSSVVKQEAAEDTYEDAEVEQQQQQPHSHQDRRDPARQGDADKSIDYIAQKLNSSRYSI
jgi:hypothetical protein